VIVDTSAIVAVLVGEPSSPAIVDVLTRSAADHTTGISAATLVELTAVLTRFGDPGTHRRADALLSEWQIETVPLDGEQARTAQLAYRDYGRGSGHPAQLNLGDCYSYALAAVRRQALLYVGDDFAHTDILPALPGGA